MPSPQTHGDADSVKADRASQPIRYPTNHVLGIIDKPEQLRSALAALESGGFLESELGVRCGEGMADALAASSGRTGLSDLAMRFTEWIGLANDEMAVKNRYEAALRDGAFVVSVAAATDERKDVAARILRDHGAHFVNFLGRFTMEMIAR
jgi:hypothetical protein